MPNEDDLMPEIDCDDDEFIPNQQQKELLPKVGY